MMPLELGSPASHPPLQRLLEVHEVAYYLKCSQETVRRLIREGKLTAIRLGTQWRVDPSDLKAFMDAHRKANGNGHASTP